MDHKREIDPNFTFEYVYESVYNREIENMMKQHVGLIPNIISKVIKSKNQTELVQLNDEFTMNKLDILIKEIKKSVESSEKDKDKNIIINALQLELHVIKNNNKELKEENDILKTDNIKLNEVNENLEKDMDGTKVVDIKINSMQNLIIKNQEIKKAVCMNFFINFIANHIKLNDNKVDFLVNISVDEFFNKYKQFRISNKYTEPIFDEKYEKSILTKSLKEIDGIMCSSYTNGDRNRIFYIKTIADWITENITIPKHFRNIFRNDCDFYNHKTINENMELRHIYDFLISLILKNICYMDKTSKGNSIMRKMENKISKLLIKNTIVTEEYLKFCINDIYTKRLTMTKIYKVIDKIPGIKLQKTILDIKVIIVCKWIIENLQIDNKIKKLFI